MAQIVDGRVRQAQFRSTSPTITSAGRSPDDPQGRRNGHLLAIGCEEQNLFLTLRGVTGATAFFRDREIKWWGSGENGAPAGDAGPTRNMASSQILCVNFLMPLAPHPNVLLALLRSLDHDVTNIVELRYGPPIARRDVASLVEFEWVGLRTSLEGRPITRGANVTSADALIVANTNRGRRRAYIFEWKYVEEYPEDEYKGAGKAGETRRTRYAERCQSSPLLSGVVPIDELLYEPFYQIVRLGLLADKMIREGEFGVAEARVAVVCPSENVQYRERITSPPLRTRFPESRSVEEVAKRLWRDPATFRMTTPEALSRAVRNVAKGGSLQGWMTYMSERYGWA